MTFLAPLALALGALSIPIIVMYILKLRRQPKVISSTFLWRRALDDVQANAPWQRLRVSKLLILQLLALLALVIVLARPAYSSTEKFSGDLVIVLDQSYGMQATDIKPDRFAAAQNDARTLAAQVPAGNVVSVIGMGAHPTLAIADGTDLGSIDGAIDGLSAGDSSPNFLEALSLASSLARNGEATRVIVLTSRQSGISTLPLQLNFPVEITRIGGKLHDMGITDFGVSATTSGSAALVRIENFGVAKETADLNLYVDGQLADVEPITLPAGQELTHFWNSIPAGSDVVEAKLQTHDEMDTDKQAWALVSSEQVRHVLLVTTGDYFLETALEVDPAVHVAVEQPSAYSASQANHEDLVVFDDYLPNHLPAAPALFMSPPDGTVGPLSFGGYATSGPVEAGGALPPAESPITSAVDVSDVHIARERTVTLPPWMDQIYTGSGNTLIAAGENANGLRLAAATFRLQDTDWPLRVSYPIMVQNLVQYLVPSVGISSDVVSAGEPVTLTPEPGVKAITVTTPSGAVYQLRRPFSTFTQTSAPGVYSVKEAGRRFTAHFVVNLLPARPAPARGPATLTIGKSSGVSSHRTSSPNELGWVLALACLGLLSAEWWLAFRR